MVALVTLFAILVFVLLTLLFRYGMAEIGRKIGSSAYDRHKCAEYIVSTYRVPDAWIKDLEARYPALSDGAERLATDNGERARSLALKRLDGLLRYFRRAPVFENEHAKRLVVGNLAAARDEWRRAPLDRLLRRAETGGSVT